MTYQCPNDPTHQSDNPDSCSICGARISRTPAASETAAEPIQVAARGNDVFLASEPVRTESIDAITAAPPEPPATPPARQRFELVVSVDPEIYVKPSPPKPCPVGAPDLHFPLDKPVNTIGRNSERSGIHPDIALADPAISHKHAIVICEPDGSLIIEDVGSSNGTQLNGKYVPAGLRLSLCAGDQIVIGCWTRIAVRTVEP